MKAAGARPAARTDLNPSGPILWCWRHPRAPAAAGRCIGRTDLPVDPRQARRLAHRLRSLARQRGLAREVWVSPLARARAVGLELASWGWRLHVDPRLAELDFGRWDGLAWAAIGWDEVQAWQADLLHHAPGGGESLAQLALRVHDFVTETRRAGGVRLLVGHGGWLNALALLPRLLPPAQLLAAADWPAPPAHGACQAWPAVAASAPVQAG